MEIKETIWKRYQEEVVDQSDIFSKREGGLKNALRVLDNSLDDKGINLDQKSRESKSKQAEFILSVHTSREMYNIPFSRISNGNLYLINQKCNSG